MPSRLHEMLVTLFRNCPTLAPGLLHTHLEVPGFTEARVESADLTDVQPTEYRADLVVVLRNDTQPVLGIIVEVQLSSDPHKRWSWPAYATNLRRRLGCPTCVLVFSPYGNVARWAAQPIRLGAGSVFCPLALGPEGMPRVVDPEQAQREPELAVLSVMAHGRGDTQIAVQIALAAIDASERLDPERRRLYFDEVMAALGPLALQELRRMDPSKFEYRSETVKEFINIGRAEGEAKGRAATLIKLLTVKDLGPLEPHTVARIQQGTIEELDTWAVRVLHATSLADVFDP